MAASVMSIWNPAISLKTWWFTLSHNIFKLNSLKDDGSKFKENLQVCDESLFDKLKLVESSALGS